MLKQFYIFLVCICAFVAKSQTTYIVTSTNDPSNPFLTVPGELRWAIEQANLTPGIDNIIFNISSSIYPIAINLQSSLPDVHEGIIMDGNSQPASGYSGIDPKIIIDGTSAGAFTLNFYSSGPGAVSGSEIRNITFISTSYFALGLYHADSNLFENNVFLGNGQSIYLNESDNNVFKSNYFGVDRSLTANPLYTLNQHGVSISYNSDHNVFGGLGSGEPNYFYNGTVVFGMVEIWWGSTYNKITGNIFVNNRSNISLFGPGIYGNTGKISPTFTAPYSGANVYINGSCMPNDVVEIYKSNSGGIDAESLLAVVNADAGGNFNTILTGLAIGDKIVATATDNQNNTSEFRLAVVTAVTPCTTFQIHYRNDSYCTNSPAQLSVLDCFNPFATYEWSFGDGTTGTGLQNDHYYANAGTYLISVTMHQPGHADVIVTKQILITPCTKVECKDCIGSFKPDAGSYILSAWVREDVTPQPKTYNNPKIEVSFGGTSIPPPVQYGTNSAKNKIIEGWQRIEEVITIPMTATDINLKLVNLAVSTDVYFDDIRIFPVDGQMKTYVYDPVTLRLSAMLDENNYATFYEYNEEGKLIRVKKETEKGIMTIQESREAIKKK